MRRRGLPQRHVVATEQDVADAAQLVAVLDQARHGDGVALPPVAEDRPGVDIPRMTCISGWGG
jgi:hypothetical protein